MEDIIDDVFNLGEYACDVFGTNSLGTGITESNGGMLELTLNYPRNVAYLKMDNEKRKVLYELLFVKLKDYLIKKYNIVRECRYTFEASNIGIHLHGFYSLDLSNVKGNVYGLVEESAKLLLQDIPCGKNRVNTIEKGIMFSSYPRFQCPAITIQYSKFERTQVWQNYINKYSLV